MAKLQAIHIINSLGTGGAEKQLALMSEELAGRGVEQVVIPIVASSTNQELAVRTIEPRPRIVASVVAAILAATGMLRKEGHSALVAWMYHSWLLAVVAANLSRRRPKIFLYCRHGEWESLRPTTKAICRLAIRLALKYDPVIVFNSDQARISHAKIIGGCRTAVVPNGVKVQEGGRRPDSGRVIGFLGRNHPDKGADLLQKILPPLLKKFPQWRFICAGPGMEEHATSIHAALEYSGVKTDVVEIFGQVNSVEFLSQCDLLLVPSRTESFPNVVIEAVMCGAIPVCTNVGCVADVLGGCVEVGESWMQIGEIAAHLCSADESVRKEIGAALYDRVRDVYDIRKVANMHLDLWGVAYGPGV